METRSYRFGDLREILRESASEFKPKFGDGVESTEQAQNKEAYRQIKKDTEEYNKGIEAPKSNTDETINSNPNLGMSDLQYDTKPSKKYCDNAKAAYGGYINAQDKENHKDEELGNGYRNEKISKALVKKAKKGKEDKDALSNSGQITKYPDKDAKDMHAGVVESKKTSLLRFKHVQFISEGHMLSHVPDEYKVENKKFYMQDCKGNKYLVEWHKQPNVEKLLNEEKTNAEMARIKELFGYDGKLNSTNNTIRMNESNNMEDMLGRVRKLMK